MKSLIFLLLLTACAPASFTAIESTPDLSCVFLPIVINETEKPRGCERITNDVTLYYVFEDRLENYQAVDCLGVEKNWEQTIERNQIVEIGDYGRQHLAIARQGDPWLQVLVWEGTQEAFILNLTREE